MADTRHQGVNHDVACTYCLFSFSSFLSDELVILNDISSIYLYMLQSASMPSQNSQHVEHLGIPSNE
jgi:hypothetical protein